MLTVKILQDEDPTNPLTEWDMFGTFALFHRRYRLSSPECPFTEPEEWQEYCKREKPLFLPVYMYEHSGITINTTGYSCPWDSYQLGVIYVSREKIRQEYSCKHITEKIRKQVYDLLRAELKTYDQYLTGEVYGYVIEDEEGETIDSCWGFYGYDDCEAQAKAQLEYWRRERETLTLDLVPA